jgi:cupin superfamily acireductone dioxygenase involved in methionine salvage
MKKVQFKNKDFIYRTTIDIYSKELLIKEILCNIDIDERVSVSMKDMPGTQSDILIKNGEIEKVSNFINDLIIEKIYEEKPFPFAYKNWIYLSESSNPHTFYHEHSQMRHMRSKAEWTWTLYVQMPDNLNGDDGKLMFKTSDGEEYGILPNEGDLLIFPADLYHKPQLNKKSTKPRIVLAGLISKLDYNKIYNKKEKTTI